MRSRTRTFIGVAAALAVALAVVVALAVTGGRSSRADVTVGVVGTAPAPAPAPDRGAPVAKPPRPDARPSEVVVRGVDSKDPRLNGPVTVVPLGGGEPRRTSLACERVAFAAGRGVCLQLEPSGVDWRAVTFDKHFHVTHSLPLTGLPSRARVSPDGRLGAYTTFVAGDSYQQPGTFSTRTRIIDMHIGKIALDLEDLTVTRDGKRVSGPDLNFWGVTFSGDDDRFYATLSTRGKTYLIAGELSTRRARILRDNVECPSLSPDGTRIAFKKLVGGRGHWRLHVLDLRTLRDHPLAETRSIDDQAEWLDDERVLYSDGRAVWATAADGSGRPTRLFARADSPTVVPARG
jgi:WD40 repeat protein